jgi:hypothetical protein
MEIEVGQPRFESVSNGLDANDQLLPPETRFGQPVGPCAGAGFPVLRPSALRWSRAEQGTDGGDAG